MDWIDINGAGLRYEISGEGPKILVLVHEMGDTLESWDQILPALRPGRIVLRYDWRGSGMSEKARGRSPRKVCKTPTRRKCATTRKSSESFGRAGWAMIPTAMR